MTRQVKIRKRYKLFLNFFNDQFIWGALPNFGEVRGLYGDLGVIAEGPLKAQEAYPDYFAGIGAFMEGINQNVVVYDLLFVCFSN